MSRAGHWARKVSHKTILSVHVKLTTRQVDDLTRLGSIGECDNVLCGHGGDTLQDPPDQLVMSTILLQAPPASKHARCLRSIHSQVWRAAIPDALAPTYPSNYLSIVLYSHLSIYRAVFPPAIASANASETYLGQSCFCW